MFLILLRNLLDSEAIRNAIACEYLIYDATKSEYVKGKVVGMLEVANCTKALTKEAFDVLITWL